MVPNAHRTEETNRKSQFMAQEVSSHEQHMVKTIFNRLLKGYI